MGFILGIDYDEMRAVAGAFERAARDEAERLSAAAQTTQAALDDWDGVASDAFEQQALSCAARSAALPDMLDRVAAMLRDTANIVQAAEDRARREIEERLRRARANA